MKAGFGVLILFGLFYGVQTYCDGRQDEAQCYGALGGSVVLQLMNSTSEITGYDWKKNTSVILKWRNNDFVSNKIENRSNFFLSNGTLVIHNLIRNDSDEYILESYHLDGKAKGRRTLKLTVQAPVSSVQLLPECLSQGERKVSCSSEGGDSPQYSWTLDGRTLTDSELLSGSKETNIITLKQHASGLLVCSVRNNISSVSKEKDISTCGFIFINCTSNGTHISKWVFKDNNSLCRDPTTAAPTTDTHRTVGVQTYCDGRQEGAQCYGALGGSLVLQLMDSASEITAYDWKKNKSKILSGKMNTIVSNSIERRSNFFPSNGTLVIHNLIRNDRSEYTLQIYNSEGHEAARRTLQLTVQAPVSSVQLLAECLSKGYIWVFCSSEGGDGPQYSWTLDGRTLTDSELLSGGKETNIITLKQHVSGRLVCSVRNRLNSMSNELIISVCRDHSLLICGLQFAAAVLSFIGIGFYFKLKKVKYTKAEESTGPHRTEESDNVLEMH